MTPEGIRSVWLVVTVVTTLEILGIAVYICHMFKRRFFFAIATLLVAVAIEQVCAEIKNYYTDPIPHLGLGWLWLSGRILEAIVGGCVLGYVVFGRNGKGAS